MHRLADPEVKNLARPGHIHTSTDYGYVVHSDTKIVAGNLPVERPGIVVPYRALLLFIFSAIVFAA